MLRLNNLRETHQLISGLKRAAIALSLAAAMIAAVACGSDDPASTPTPTPSTQTPTPTVTPTPVTPTPSPYQDFHPTLGEPFDLLLGGSAFVDEHGYRITFVRVVSDSRCPANVQCIVAGAATIEISVRTAAGEPEQTYTLAIGDPASEPKSVAIGGFEIEFLELAPYPGGTPGPTQATLVVRAS
jgi:hypothetical protein